MIRIAVCDDNELQREILQDLIHEYSLTPLCATVQLDVHCFACGRELVLDVRNNGGYDIYIQDMIMPDVNGMEVATTLRLMGDEGKIIFLTASLEYAVASYEVDAFYYMIKPVDREKLFRVLDRAVSLISEDSSTVGIKSKTGMVTVKYEDVVYIDLENRALRYHLKDGRVICGNVIRVPFRETIAPFLGRQNFTLCGVSMVVNLDCIDQMDSDSILFADGSLVYPSKTACSALKTAWLQRKIR